MGLEDHVEYKASVKVWQVISPMLIVLGTLGNVLTIAVLTRPKSRRKPTAVFLTALATSDLLVLYMGLLRQWIKHQFHVDIRRLNSPGCRFHVFLVYFSTQFSSWLLVIVTLERVAGSWCPHRVRAGCTTRSAATLIAVTALGLAALNLHWFFGLGDVTYQSGNVTYYDNCDTMYDDYHKFLNFTWPWIDLCFYCLIPFSILLIGNAAILTKVIKSRQRSSRRVVPVAGNPRAPVRKKSDKTTSLTVMLVTLNVVFFLCVTPISVFLIGEPYFLAAMTTTKDEALFHLWWAIVNVFMYTNNTVNFILYFLSGSRFRQEVKALFCGGGGASIFGGSVRATATRVAPKFTVQTVAESLA